MAQIDSRLGDMIRSYREKLGLTQEEMAERLQVNLTHYGNIERAACNQEMILPLRLHVYSQNVPSANVRLS